MTDRKWVYSFGDGGAEGTVDMKPLLGGKGANLAEMSRLGLPVPPGSRSQQRFARHFTTMTATTRQVLKRRF